MQAGRVWRSLFLPLLALCTLAAWGLRLKTLDQADPWWDEGYTYWLGSLDVPTLLLRTAGDVHPPLSYLLYHLWLPLAGPAVYALRALSAMFGALSVPAIGVLGRRLGGPWAGLLAAALLAVSRFDIWWSQQIRMYALVGLLCIVSVYLLLGGLAAWKAQPRRARWLLVGAAAVNLTGMYTLYFFGLLVVLESLLALAWVVRWRSRALAGWWLALQAACGVLLLPWLLFFREHALHYAQAAVSSLPLPLFLEAGWSELALGIDTNVQSYRAIALPLAVATVVAVVTLSVERRVPRPPREPSLPPTAYGASSAQCETSRLVPLWLLLATLAFPVAAYAGTLRPGSFFNPMFHTRYELPALPALVLLLAWGASRLRGWARLAPLVLFAAAAAVTLPDFYAAKHRGDDYQTLSRFVQAYEQPGD
ncbi:MAG: glycosyltransferase family 39 protein, partial [Chloroflexi bacterium]|nr:glycosyltransferase family 39 protein [Chloroflexota bacterium]